MTRQQLAHEWHDGDAGLRAMRAKHYHGALREAVGERPPRQVDELEEWLEEHHDEISEALAGSDDGDAEIAETEEVV